MRYYPYKTKGSRQRKWKEIFSLGNGGLVETVELLNSLIIGLILAISVLLYDYMNQADGFNSIFIAIADYPNWVHIILGYSI